MCVCVCVCVSHARKILSIHYLRDKSFLDGDVILRNFQKINHSADSLYNYFFSHYSVDTNTSQSNTGNILVPETIKYQAVQGLLFKW